MPVSVKIDPFSKQPIRRDLPLRTPQARALSVLMPDDQSLPESEWSAFGKAQLQERMGLTPLSGTLTRVLNGIREGSSSGDPHPGLLARGLVVEIPIDVEGVSLVLYQITRAGVEAYEKHVREHGKLPTMRSREASTNLRYTNP